jgi:hypothetical protein
MDDRGRQAFVLHGLFAVPFEEVAAILGRSGAARKLASRARRRVRREAPVPTPRPGRRSRLSPATSGVRARPVVTFG